MIKVLPVINCILFSKFWIVLCPAIWIKYFFTIFIFYFILVTTFITMWVNCENYATPVKLETQDKVWGGGIFKTSLAQPIFRFLLLPVWTMFVTTILPTSGLKLSSLPFMHISASVHWMWHTSDTSLFIGLEKFLTFSYLNLTSISSPVWKSSLWLTKAFSWWHFWFFS